jgi:hypothetical protein
MPREREVVKQPPAYQAGDHDAFSEYLLCAKQYDDQKRAEKQRWRNTRVPARTRQTDHFVR